MTDITNQRFIQQITQRLRNRRVPGNIDFEPKRKFKRETSKKFLSIMDCRHVIMEVIHRFTEIHEMPQAHADPEEIRRFAMQLKQFQEDLAKRMGAIQGQLMHLGQTWKDHEHEKFVTEFDQASLAVRRFLEVSESHIPLLLRKAARLDEYLGQK